MIRSFIRVALATSCLAIPVTVQSRVGIAIVHRADLDLSRVRDVRRLDHRIARAAAAACGPVSTIDPITTNLHALCTRETIAATQNQRDAAIRRRAGIRQAGTHDAFPRRRLPDATAFLEKPTVR